MTFGRWLLVHSFSIFLVTLFILGYIYRDELQLQQAYEQLLAKPSKPENLESSKPVEEKATEQPSIQATQETPPDEPAPPSDEASSIEPATGFIESTPTISTTIIDLNELLLKARKAYWDKDYALAIQHYKQLIQDDAANPDYRGELGNIYYSLNDYDDAAMHYYQAAQILIRQGKYEQARLLVSPISAMNRDLGDQLKRKLSQP